MKRLNYIHIQRNDALCTVAFTYYVIKTDQILVVLAPRPDDVNIVSTRNSANDVLIIGSYFMANVYLCCNCFECNFAKHSWWLFWNNL